MRFDPIRDDDVPQIDNRLAVGFDPEFENKWWKTERISWAVMFVVVAAGLCGVFGRGPFSHRTVNDTHAGITVEYERVVRYKTPATIRVYFHPGVVSGEQLFLQVSSTIVRQLGEERVIPQPAASVPLEDGLLYTFPRPSIEQVQQVSFSLEPESVGILRIHIGIPGRPSFIAKVIALP